MAARSLRVVSMSRTCGNVFENHRFVGEQSRRHARECGVLRATDSDRAEQRVATADYELIHRLSFFLKIARAAFIRTTDPM